MLLAAMVVTLSAVTGTAFAQEIPDEEMIFDEDVNDLESRMLSEEEGFEDNGFSIADETDLSGAFIQTDDDMLCAGEVPDAEASQSCFPDETYGLIEDPDFAGEDMVYASDPSTLGAGYYDDEDDDDAYEDEDDEDGDEEDGDEEDGDEEEEETEKEPEEITRVSISGINSEVRAFQKPKYEARVEYGNVSIVYEGWECEDGRVNKSNRDYNLGSSTFSKFELGKKYTYL